MATTYLKDLQTPCFLVDIDKVRENANRMRKTCEHLGVTLRPHTKTHKTLEAAELQTGGSMRCIAVSTLAEAEFYADSGFDDILLAHPITPQKLHRCIGLLQQLDRFHVMVSNLSGIECLEKCSKDLPMDKNWSVVLEVDTGFGRTGFCWNSTVIVEAAQRVVNSNCMRLESIYNHCGHSYGINSAAERAKLQESDVRKLLELQEKLKLYGIECPMGTGSTPTCSLPISDMQKLSEFHPGNYIFYDYEMYLLNACRQQDIACKVMTRVIAHKPELNMILIDCGFTGLSHDGMMKRPADFCLIEGEANLRLIGMSQEIGKVKAKEGDLDCRKYPVGTILFLIPYHSCTTAAMHQIFHVHTGNKVITTWRPVKGW